MAKISDALERINFQIPFGRWQLFEFMDLWIVPPFIKYGSVLGSILISEAHSLIARRHDQQDTLSAHWTKKVPFLQTSSAAELLAEILASTLNSTHKSSRSLNGEAWKLIDISSGTGGPMPIVETLLNQQRAHSSNAPIPFLLTSPTPNLDAWIPLAAKSDNLSFIPQPVDPAKPPFSIISTSTRGDKEAAARAGFEDDGRKVMRTYCGSFHHFDEVTAREVVESTMQTSDGFVIVELQERRILSLILVFLEVCMSYLLAIFWFWDDGVHLFFTLIVPLLPVMQVLDGLVTCLRVRSFEEILDFIPGNIDRVEGRDGSVVIQNWSFKYERILHTWPLGYMNVITGTSLSHLSPEPV